MFSSESQRQNFPHIPEGTWTVSMVPSEAKLFSFSGDAQSMLFDLMTLWSSMLPKSSVRMHSCTFSTDRGVTVASGSRHKAASWHPSGQLKWLNTCCQML